MQLLARSLKTQYNNHGVVHIGLELLKYTKNVLFHNIHSAILNGNLAYKFFCFQIV